MLILQSINEATLSNKASELLILRAPSEYWMQEGVQNSASIHLDILGHLSHSAIGFRPSSCVVRRASSINIF